MGSTRYALPGQRGDFRSPFAFGELPEDLSGYDGARIVLLPVPVGRAGELGGPRAILAASRNLELYDQELDKEPYLLGIHTLPELACPAGDPRELPEQVERVVGDLIEEDKYIVTLGGDATVAIGCMRAHRRSHADLAVLCLSGRARMRDDADGSAYALPCAARRMAEAARLCHLGARSLSQEDLDGVARTQSRLITMEEIAREGVPSVGDELSAGLAPHVYISLDLGVIDPSVMPSTFAPEPGGLGYPDLLNILRKVANEHQVVGFDITGLAPIPGLVAPDHLAARLTYKLLGYVFFGGNPPRERGEEEEELALPQLADKRG